MEKLYSTIIVKSHQSRISLLVIKAVRAKPTCQKVLKGGVEKRK